MATASSTPGLEADPGQGPEATPAEFHRSFAPQTLPGPEKEALRSELVGLETEKIPIPATPKVSTIRQRWKLWLLIAAAATAIVVITVAVPLRLQHSKGNGYGEPASISTRIRMANDSGSNNSELAKPALNELPPQTFSSSGAFNGTSLATFNVLTNNELATHVFYQDYEGQLRRVEKNDSKWSGGPVIPAIVASNAKNATPLACVNYTDSRTNSITVTNYYHPH